MVGGDTRQRMGALDSIGEIDLSLPTPSWRVLPQRLNKERYGCCAIAQPKNPNYIVVGGGCDCGDKPLRCCEVICWTKHLKKRLPSMMTPRVGHTLVLV